MHKKWYIQDEHTGTLWRQRKFDFFNIRKKTRMRILNSLIVPKYLKGGPFGLFGTLVCSKISKKNLKVGPFEGKKNWEKSRTVPKKNWKGGPKMIEKFLVKARTRTRDSWVHREPSKVCTKNGTYTMRSVVWRKKLATVIVGFFSIEKRRLETRWICFLKDFWKRSISSEDFLDVPEISECSVSGEMETNHRTCNLWQRFDLELTEVNFFKPKTIQFRKFFLFPTTLFKMMFSQLIISQLKKTNST